MGPEMWIALLAVFVSGGAVGTVGTLLTQWLLKRLDPPPMPSERLRGSELDLLRSEVAELGRHVHNMDARLDFTERLLDGALPLSPAPSRIQGSGLAAADARPGEPRPQTD
ncbi:MAG: hypothetical protein FJ207_05505 [Gemmatimonadetes bacterium]|nr:hypothetical protein [Gemmatimonadota bacterium]